jgi:hypothetical protein
MDLAHMKKLKNEIVKKNPWKKSQKSEPKNKYDVENVLLIPWMLYVTNLQICKKVQEEVGDVSMLILKVEWQELQIF